VVALRPDPDHPVSQGYACRKGTTFHERVAGHPERVLRPRLRDGSGWRDVPWEEALATLGARLRAIRVAHGPEAVGLYSGNAAGHAFGTVLGLAAFQRALGTTKHYSCLTLDNSAMFVVAEQVFGNPMATFVADYERSDLVVLAGTDPLESHASQSQGHPRAGIHLRDRARQGQLLVVDPRTSVTAARASVHLQPRVGTDVFLLTWLVREALDAVRPDPLLDEADRAALRVATEGFSRDRAARVTGLASSALQALRDRLLGAQRPLVWSGLGVLLGPHGLLGWWLTLCLQAALGGLDRPGGWVLQPGVVDIPRWAKRIGLRAHDGVRAPIDGWPAILGTLPAATLPRDVLRDAPDRLRALVVVAGDPLLALPDASAARAAFEALDLLICIDLRSSATAELAHALLPATTWLERDESAVHTGNQRPVPHLRLDRAVVAPPGEVREELSILTDLCRASGAPLAHRLAARALSALGATGVLRALAAVGGVSGPRLTAGVLGAATHGVLRAGHPAIARPRLAVPAWCDALRALSDPAPDGLRLITSVRPVGAMNHWLRRGDPVPARLHPDDWPHGPGPALLRGPGGDLRVEVVPDPTLARGAVVMPFGDRRRNPNAVVGSADLEAFTGQPLSNGCRVTVTPDPVITERGGDGSAALREDVPTGRRDGRTP
jgi:anaerobic selenocysteine-containing dehydrogenase